MKQHKIFEISIIYLSAACIFPYIYFRVHLRSRYLAVTQPLIYSRRRRSKRLAGLMIVAVWVLAGAITSPPLLGCFPRATNRDIKKCSYNMDSSYVIFSAMGSFFLPMLVMLYVYGRISCVIASRHRNLETSEAENVRARRKITIERSKSVRTQRTDYVESNMTCERPSEEAEPTSMCRKLGTIRGNQQSCINRVARETKTAGTLAVVVGGFVACWLPFFILYLATPFVPMEPPDILMPALTWLGRWRGWAVVRHPPSSDSSTNLGVDLAPGQNLASDGICHGDFFLSQFPFRKRRFSIKIVLSDKRLSDENKERRKNGTVRADSGGE
ncbi:5-hydroxytryptamine receptor-like isoform X3 [Odontomachus brunneus]|uniref:5-hydroxytryptamine receptor-like isoform X3 n=1 Tax=Odontomachus brunneus TaxID=486640 RepID=UPI0013F1DEB1|nr:5-hydroxytryptamine receptor-like isoform X3 [Odontomachus brunneus]